MSERSRLVAEAGQQISNPFLLCALVSRRTRQLMMAGNADTNTAQVVDSVLCEVIAGALLGKPRRPFVVTEESPSEEKRWPTRNAARPGHTRGGSPGGGSMRRRIKVRELMQREGLREEVIELFHSRNTGLIHGDDGYDLTFTQESLAVGLSYRQLSLGLKVSYGIFFAIGAKIPTAINVMPASGEQPETADEEKHADSTRAGGLGIV